MPKQLTNAQKAEIAKKNAENTALQRASAAQEKAQKKEQQRLAEEQKLEVEREAAYKEYMKVKSIAITKRYYQRMVNQNTARIVKAFVVKLREKIWNKKIAQITKLAVSSSEKKIILVKFYIDQDYSAQHKKFYIIFEVVEKDGFKLDLSIYKNYIFSKIVSTLNMFNPESYQYIRESAQFEMATVHTILNEHFSYFDEKQVIKYISMLQNRVYENLIGEFSSEFYQGVSSMLNECLKHTFEKCAKSHNLDITKVSDYEGKTVSAWYYQNRAQKLYNSYDSNEYSDDDEDYDRTITFKTGVRYYNGCRECNTKNWYTFTFHIGFDLKSKMHSIVYNKTHYTFVNMDDLFKQLMKEGAIYDKPICQNCCKKNEVEQEVSMVMSKLPGLIYIGEPNYAVKCPMELNNPYDSDSYESPKECITIKLPVESSQCNGRLNIIQIIKRSSYVKVEEPMPKNEDEGMRYSAYYGRHNAPRTQMVTKQITQYTARVPIFRRYKLWSPATDVTIAFRNMQITFGLCQSMLSCRLPDRLFRYIFSFIIIPDMYSNTFNLEFELGKLDNFKLIEDFVNKVNFRLIQEN